MRKFVLAAIAILATAGCSDDEGGTENAEPEGRTGSFVGKVEGTDAYVAVVVGPDGDVVAVATDGAVIADRLDGGLQSRGDRTARLGNDGGAVLEATFEGSSVTGTYTRPGNEPWTFTAERERAPAGLYNAQEFFADGEYAASWIVFPDGTQRGSVRRYETPLPPGSVDTATFSPGDKEFPVPGGVLKPRRVTPDSDF